MRLRALKYAYEGQKIKCDTATGEVSQLIANEEDLLADLEDCTRLDEIYYDTISNINEKLNSVAAADVKPVVAPTSEPATVKDAIVSGPRHPEIKLKHFAGDIVSWQTWWDQYESSVHNKNSIADVDKFSYLISLLDGSAADCVAGLKLTSENYNAVAL